MELQSGVSCYCVRFVKRMYQLRHGCVSGVSYVVCHVRHTGVPDASYVSFGLVRCVMLVYQVIHTYVLEVSVPDIFEGVAGVLCGCVMCIECVMRMCDLCYEGMTYKFVGRQVCYANATFL